MRYTEKIRTVKNRPDFLLCRYGLHIKNNKKILDGYNELVYTNHCKEVR